MVELEAVMQRLRDEAKELNFERNSYHAENKKKLESETTSVLSRYAEGRFDLLLDSHSGVLYNKHGFAVDVTDAVIKSIWQVDASK